MAIKRMSHNSSRFENDHPKLPKTGSQFSLGSEEGYRVFKKNGFVHQRLEGLRMIPIEEHWERGEAAMRGENSQATLIRSISRLSSQETLTMQEPESRRVSNPDSDTKTDSLKDLQPDVDIEKESAISSPDRDPGRARPEVFDSTIKEVIFVICILMSLSMAEFVISGFQVVLPALIEPLHIPQVSRTWPSSVLTLVVGSFLFPMGRLADMYGGYLVYCIGMAWFITWTIIAGFAQSLTMLVVCRAMAGLGAAAFLPSGITMLGRIYQPGPRKNLVFSIYGALSPIGFFSGIVTGGIATDYLSWKWFFWIGGMLAVASYAGVVLIAPKDYEESKAMNVKMDWLGVFTMIPGFMLVVFAIQDSSRAPGGWGTPRILICLVIGILFLGSSVYIEGWVAEAPLVPADIFRVKYMKRMLLALFLTWGVFAIYLFYANFYIQEILHKAPLMTALWFAPWAVGGVFLATISGFILHLIPGSVLLFISGTSKITAVLLFALMPENPNYWAWVMPAMLAEAACVDVAWIVSNIFLTTSLPKNRQGLAGALINVSVYLGSAFFLALADVASGVYEGMGWDKRKQYQGIFFFGAALGGVALLICLFIPLGRATGAPDSNASEITNERESRKSGASDTDRTLCGSPLGSEGAEYGHEKPTQTNLSFDSASTGDARVKARV